LQRYLIDERVDALIDATHPFAYRMKANAMLAAHASGVPRLAVLRPPWHQQPGDDWRPVSDMVEAFHAIGPAPRRVFLTVGQQELAPFKGPHRYVIRSVDPPHPACLPPDSIVIAARGPFGLSDELVLLREHGIEILVTKNSGGAATAPKIEAARAQKLPVVMVGRPIPPSGKVVETAAEALEWLAHQAGLPCWRGV